DPFQRLLLKVGFDSAALRFVIATERRACNAPSETIAGFTALRSHWGTVRHWKVRALSSHSLHFDRMTVLGQYLKPNRGNIDRGAGSWFMRI
ncbi:hypothetical protein N9L08_04950, partial [Rhodobacteraceae bacterium]|nr:hypothetical protein [Paracoccaceae bacterium]